MALGSDPFDAESRRPQAGWRARTFGTLGRLGAAAQPALHSVRRMGRRMGGRVSQTVTTALSRVPVPNIPLPGPLQRAVDRLGTPNEWWSAIADGFHRHPLVTYISKSLVRRILVSNMIGFVILAVGILAWSMNSGWVINAKRDALKVQGQIIAAAIAGDVKVQSRRSILDPTVVTEDAEPRVPLRDDGFAALELSIRPERVAPILRRLIEPTNTRARIYARDGTLVVDSADVLRIGDSGVFGSEKEYDARPRTKNFWTRLQHWLIDREVQVYKEIGNANGKYYPEVRQALEGKPEAMLLLNERGEQIVSQAIPIRRMKTTMGALLLSTRPGEVDEILADVRWAILPLVGFAILASIITSWLLARTVAGPMKRLSAAAGEVSRDINAHNALPEYADRHDEVGKMAKAFRHMTEALFRRIEASEKFAADVAHELKNPLTAASSTAQSLAYAKNDEQRDQLVQQIQMELKRLNQLINDVSSASRLDAELARQAQDPVPMDDVLRSVISIFEGKAADRGCMLKLEISTRTPPTSYIVKGNDGRLAQVLTNLIDNAVSFSDEGTSVLVSAKRIGGNVIIFVDDEGPGIDPQKLGTVFDRFYTYRPTALSSRGNNSGLGLSISREIVVAHGGRIWAENRVPLTGGDHRDGDSDDGSSDGSGATTTGARFIVELPAAAPLVSGLRGDGQGVTRRS